MRAVRMRDVMTVPTSRAEGRRHDYGVRHIVLPARRSHNPSNCLPHSALSVVPDQVRDQPDAGIVEDRGRQPTDPVVARVRILYGNSALGPNDGGGVDVAVMDDFIFGEPVLP